MRAVPVEADTNIACPKQQILVSCQRLLVLCSRQQHAVAKRLAHHHLLCAYTVAGLLWVVTGMALALLLVAPLSSGRASLPR